MRFINSLAMCLVFNSFNGRTYLLEVDHGNDKSLVLDDPVQDNLKDNGHDIWLKENFFGDALYNVP